MRDLLGDEIAAVGQRDFDFLHAIDDVEVGENIAPFVDHDAGAHAVDAPRAIAADRRVFAGVERLLAVDIDDRIAARFRWPARSACAVRRRHEACETGDSVASATGRPEPRLAIRWAVHASMRCGTIRIAASIEDSESTGRGPVSLHGAALTARSSKSALTGNRFRRGDAGGTTCLISLQIGIRGEIPLTIASSLPDIAEISGQANCVSSCTHVRDRIVRSGDCR